MGGKKKILIIDDDKYLLRTFTRMLEDTDYTVHTANDLKSGEALIQLTTYDAILLDYHMEEDKGKDFIDAGGWDKSKTKMLLILGHVTHEKVRYFFMEGVNGYLLKPFNKEDLLGTLNVHLSIDSEAESMLQNEYREEPEGLIGRNEENEKEASSYGEAQDHDR